MDFGLTAEQQQLAQAECSWLKRHDPIARVRQTPGETALIVDSDALSHATESGLLALLTEEVGGTHVDLGVVCEAHGAAASSLPIADLALAAWILATLSHSQATSAARGQLLCSVAHGPDATQTADGTLWISGRSRSLPVHTDLAALVIVGAIRKDGKTTGDEYLALLESPDLRVMKTLDLTRPWAYAVLDAQLGADQWSTMPAGTLATIDDALAVHRAFDALGSAARLLEMTVDYAGQRRQFGVPIGSFQAIKHHCANMAIGVEAGRSALWASALGLTAEDEVARRRSAASGAAFAKSAASDVAQLALQVHGGIGFTWEHDLHLFLRRIKVDEAMNGSPAQHRAALVAL